jgi:2,3-bisphosphoglycerate-independent phosphoglycerate mutase
VEITKPVTETVNSLEEQHVESSKAVAGDSVVSFGEIAAARGCLGRFTGSEMMGVIKGYLELP